MTKIQQLKTGDSVSQTKLQKQYYTYKWDSDWDNGWGLTEDSYAQRLGSFATMLSGNINKAVEQNSAGAHVFGMPKHKVETFTKAQLGLESFLANLDVLNGTYKGEKLNENALRDLANISRTVGVDSNRFLEYFLDYLPKETVTTRNLKSRRDEGLEVVNASDLGYNQEVLNYLTNNNINLMQDTEGNIFAYNKDYSAYAPLSYINTDWRDNNKEGSSYNWGIFTDNNGKVWYGNYGDMDTDNQMYDTISDYISDVNASRGNQFKVYNNFNPNLNYTRDNKTVYDFVNRLGEAANIKHKFNNFADVSGLFKGKKHVIAVKDDGSNFNTEGLAHGTLEFTPDVTFYYIGNDGQLHGTKWGDPDLEAKIGKYNPNGWKETANQIGSQLKGIELGTSNITSDKVKDPVQWTTKMLSILSKPATQRTGDDIRFLEKFDGLEHKENVLSYIGALLQDGTISLNPQGQKMWERLTEKYRTDNLIQNYSPQIDDETLTQQLIEEANKAGYSSVADYKDSQRQPSKEGWSAADIARLSAIGLDIGSLLASFGSATGVGAIASASLGAAGSFTNFGADWSEDGLQARDFGNLAKNLMWDVAGVVPGVKALKIAKSLKAVILAAKNIPTVIGTIQTFANADEYFAMIDKLKKDEKLTVRDWQLLGQLVKNLVGFGRVNLNRSTGSIKDTGAALKAPIDLTVKGVRATKHGYSRMKAVQNPQTKERLERYQKYVKELATQSNSSSTLAKSKNLESNSKTKSTENKQNNKKKTEAPKQQETTSAKKRNGGKLDRFGEYLNSHK